MYLSFFGLLEPPFNVTPDPRFLYVYPGFREALSALRYGIEHRKGFISLIGDAGTGKTTLLRTLLTELGDDVRTVLVLNPAVSFLELLHFILSDLGRPPRPGAGKLEMLQRLNDELLATLSRGGKVVLLVDEAQDMPVAALEELRLLSNLETSREKILQIVLAGQPELDATLDLPELRQLRQRIAVPARLRPLSRRDVAAYIAARIETAGGDPRGLFTRPALWRLWRFSRGIPRSINVACDLALLAACEAGSRRVGAGLMGRIVADLRGGARRPAWPAARWAMPAGALAAVAGVLLARHAVEVAPPAPSTDATASAAARAPEAMRVDPLGGGRGAGAAAPPTHDAAGGEAGAQGPEAVRMSPPPSAGAPPPAAVPDDAALRTPAPASAPPHEEHATADAAVAAAEAAAPAPPAATGAVTVVMEKGDYLVRMVRRHYGYDSPALMDAIRLANPGLSNLDVIPVGQPIILPPDPQAR